MMGEVTLSRAPSNRWSLAAGAIILATAVAIGTWLCVTFWSFTVDDTFITLRYARNLAQGYGLTWNPGETPAEGYTSFAWTVSMAALHVFTDDAETTAKVASLLVGLLGVALSAGLAADALGGESVRVRIVGVAFVVMWQVLQLGTTVHAVSGMDTTLFTTSIVILSWCSYRVLQNPTQLTRVAFALCSLACGLSRPEGNIFAFVLALATWLSLKGPQRRAFAQTWLTFYVLPALFYFICRIAYYGHLFPLPFYVKAVGTDAFFAGAREAADFLYELGVESPSFAVLALAGILRGPRMLRPVWLAGLAMFLFFLKPVPLMAYNHRYLHPLIPLFAVAGAVGIQVVLRAVRARVRIRTSQCLVFGLVVLACVGAAAFSWRALPANRADKDSYARGLQRAHKELGLELALKEQTTGERRIALLDVGAVAYYARDWSVLDTFGLTDATIALRGRDETEYVLSRDPTFIVFVSSNPDEVKLVFPHEQALLAAAKTAGYRPTSTREFVPDYYLVVFEK